MTTGNTIRARPDEERGGEVAALLRLAWPMMATQFLIMATGFLDTVMAGRYDATDLAGVSLGGNVMWPAFMLISGVTMALTPIVSQLRGSGDVAASGARIRQALWLCLISSAILVAICRNAAGFYAAAGIEGPMVDVAVGYLQAVSWGLPALVFYVALRQVCEGLGLTRPPMYIAAAVLPLNAGLNYLLIYGAYGAPELGGVGCGVATAIVFWVELALMAWYVRRPVFRTTMTFARIDGPSLREILRLLRLGLPIGLTVFLEMAVFAVVGLAVGTLGEIELAAHSIVGNLNWLTYVLPAGLGAAASIRVGYFVGSRDLAGARHAAATSYQMALVYGVIVSVLIIALRSTLVGLYTTDPAVVQIALGLILFVALYQIVDDANAVAVGALRGYKDTRWPMIYGLVGFWFVGLPVGTALAFSWPWPGLDQALGVYGYWIGVTVGLFLVAAAVSWRLFRTCRDEVLILRLSSH